MCEEGAIFLLTWGGRNQNSEPPLFVTSRRRGKITNPERFLYCPATMHPEWTPEFEHKFHDDLIEQYRRALNKSGISPESREVFEEVINIHKRCKTTR